jgi:hypothetical protein
MPDNEFASALQAHPLADLFPLLEGAEFDELVADIRANGVREPIWTYQDKILDGRNRYRTAQVAEVACPTRIYEGNDPLGLVISLNLKRRHLSTSKRSRTQAVVKLLQEWNGRVVLAQAVGATIDLVRKQEADAEQREAALHRRDLEVERLQALRETQGW